MNRNHLQQSCTERESNEWIWSDEELVEIHDELDDYYDEDTDGTGMIGHPLITYMGYDPESREALIHVARMVKLKKERLQEAIAEKDWSLAIMLHEKPWRLHALMEYAPEMSDEEYWSELGSIWCQIENPGMYLAVLPDLFNPRNRGLEKRHLMMTEEEQAALRALPEKVTIYRGCVEGNRRGFSWSLDREKAEWFAQRWTFASWIESALLVIGECRKSDVIAHFTRRNEEEIVINPDDVTIIDSVTVPDDGDEVAVEVGEVGDV